MANRLPVVGDRTSIAEAVEGSASTPAGSAPATDASMAPFTARSVGSDEAAAALTRDNDALQRDNAGLKLELQMLRVDRMRLEELTELLREKVTNQERTIERLEKQAADASKSSSSGGDIAELLREKVVNQERTIAELKEKVAEASNSARGGGVADGPGVTELQRVVALARADPTVRVIATADRHRAAAVERCGDGMVSVHRGFYGGDTTFGGWVGQHVWAAQLTGMFAKGTAFVVDVHAAGAPPGVQLEAWLGSCKEGDAAPPWPPSARAS